MIWNFPFFSFSSIFIFDKVIFANHSDQALKLLDDPSPEENMILGALPYQKNVALLHTDSEILPNKKESVDRFQA